MVKRLYHYEIEPGDPDHLDSFYFTNGIIAAEPDEIERIKADVNGRHYGFLRISAAEEKADGIEKLMAEIGSGLDTLHGEEVENDEPCAEDASYLSAYKAEEEKRYASSDDEEEEES